MDVRAPRADALTHDAMNQDASAALLLETTVCRRRQAADEARARELAAELGGLAPALELAAAFMNENSSSLADYLERWRIHRQRLKGLGDDGLCYHPPGLAVTFLATFDALTLDARRLLQILSWLAPAPIPPGLFDDAGPLAAGTAVPEDAKRRAESGNAVQAALGELVRYALVRGGAENQSPQMDASVQEIARLDLPRSEREGSLRAALTWIGAAFPSDPETPPVLDALAPHALAVARFAEQWGIGDPAARLMNALGVYLGQSGQWDMAEPLLLRALALYEKHRGAQDPCVAACAISLGRLLEATNRQTEAEPYYRRAIRIYEEHFGPDHPNTATALNDLALLLKNLNRISEAESLYRRALAIYETGCGCDHPSVAAALNNLALLLKDTNRPEEAASLLCRALAIYEDRYGFDHPSVATASVAFAQLLKDAHHVEEAEACYRQALAIYERNYGEDHPDVGSASIALAQVLKETGRAREAESFYRRAIAIAEKHGASDQPAFATALFSLAQVLKDTDRRDEAEVLFRRALDIYESSYGPEHPYVAIALNSFALLLEEQNRLDDAEPLMLCAVAILREFSRLSGFEHPQFRLLVDNYRWVRKAQGLSDAQAAAELKAIGPEFDLAT